jgi:hypothetical protein
VAQLLSLNEAALVLVKHLQWMSWKVQLKLCGFLQGSTTKVAQLLCFNEAALVLVTHLQEVVGYTQSSS